MSGATSSANGGRGLSDLIAMAPTGMAVVNRGTIVAASNGMIVAMIAMVAVTAVAADAVEVIGQIEVAIEVVEGEAAGVGEALTVNAYKVTRAVAFEFLLELVAVKFFTCRSEIGVIVW
mmetsp:Transcript_24242/g.40107  ORF Transcript_24242/g.40107 Transcript_24242/m.40107 type:complete len:119 (+) Transcript_24242:2067-2423(+)